MIDKNISPSAYEDILRKIAVEVTIPKGTQFPSNNIYYLKKGICALTHVTKGGGESSYIYFKPGMLLGFLPHLTGAMGLRSPFTRKRFLKIDHTIYAKTVCQCFCVNGAIFMDSLDENPLLYRLLVMSVTENFINLLALSTDISALPAGVRVCQAILDFMEDSPPYTIPRYMTYNEIAYHLSMHVITVTKVFVALRQQGIINKHGHTTVVVDRERLARIVEGEEEFRY